MIVHRIAQRSPEWFALRRGIPTASVADRIVTPTGKLSAQSDGLINQLLAERAGFEEESFSGEWLEHGIEMEGEATDFFHLDTGLQVEAVGFITNAAGTAGCSPDGLVTTETGELIGWEGKAPKASTHFGYLRESGLPAKYRPQVHFSLAVSGLDRWVFQSYCRGLDPLIVWVERDDYTRAVEFALECFLEQLETEAARFGLGREPLRAAA